MPELKGSFIWQPFSDHPEKITNKKEKNIKTPNPSHGGRNRSSCSSIWLASTKKENTERRSKKTAFFPNFAARLLLLFLQPCCKKTWTPPLFWPFLPLPLRRHNTAIKAADIQPIKARKKEEEEAFLKSLPFSFLHLATKLLCAKGGIIMCCRLLGERSVRSFDTFSLMLPKGAIY